MIQNVGPSINLNRPKFGTLALTSADRKEIRAAFEQKQLMFWDVDTQKGFMWPIVEKVVNGVKKRIGLYVGGAEQIVPQLKQLTDLAQKLRIPLVATMDTHEENDPEFQLFTAVSDEHERKGAEDWPKIPETTPFGIPRQIDVNPAVDDVPSVQELREVFDANRSVVLEKNTLSFCNRRVGTYLDFDKMPPNPKGVQLIENLKQLGVRIAVVYGVATDFCVQRAVQGLKALGVRPVVVSDAVKGVFKQLDEIENNEVYKDVTVLTSAELKSILEDGAPSA